MLFLKTSRRLQFLLKVLDYRFDMRNAGAKNRLELFKIISANFLQIAHRKKDSGYKEISFESIKPISLKFIIEPNVVRPSPGSGVTVNILGKLAVKRLAKTVVFLFFFELGEERFAIPGREYAFVSIRDLSPHQIKLPSLPFRQIKSMSRKPRYPRTQLNRKSQTSVSLPI